GFIVTGTSPKKMILRALGPSLVEAGVPGRLDDPTMELISGASGSIASNDNWKDSQQSEIEQTGIPPRDERESAIVRTLQPGAYTAIVRGKSESTGIAVVEMYDLEQTTPPRLANVSSRGVVGTDDGVMIGGFIVGAGQGTNGTGSARVVLRGIGPSLSQSGTANPLSDPELLLVDGNGSVIRANNDWRETQEAELQATGIAPTNDRESAMVLALPSGNYTAILRGRGGATGVGLVEAYNVQ
nr:hypothetical protein [Chthoniobacterales bacterium]